MANGSGVVRRWAKSEQKAARPRSLNPLAVVPFVWHPPRSFIRRFFTSARSPLFFLIRRAFDASRGRPSPGRRMTSARFGFPPGPIHLAVAGDALRRIRKTSESPGVPRLPVRCPFYTRIISPQNAHGNYSLLEPNRSRSANSVNNSLGTQFHFPGEPRARPTILFLRTFPAPSVVGSAYCLPITPLFP